MIFASLGLLVVAAILLFVGIAKSSLPPLIISLVCTVGAAGMLYASFLYYRKKALEESGATAGVGPGYPLGYAAGGAVAAAAPPPAPAAAPVAPAMPTATGSNGHGNLPVDGWDELNAQQASNVVATLNLDELHQVRRYEV